MAQPYVGEIKMFAGSFAPVGWMFCEGQLLSISENEQLFGLIGTTYGGDGQSTFALPDLQGRLPVHQGNGYVLGETGGVEEVTLNLTQIPVHTHNRFLAQSPSLTLYREDVADTPLAGGSLSPAGGSQPHYNVQPYLCINHIISLFGIYPPAPSS
jgi:microcystin-dependent protein